MSKMVENKLYIFIRVCNTVRGLFVTADRLPISDSNSKSADCQTQSWLSIHPEKLSFVSLLCLRKFSQNAVIAVSARCYRDNSDVVE